MLRPLPIIASLALAVLLAGCAYPYNVGIKAADGTTVALMPGLRPGRTVEKHFVRDVCETLPQQMRQ